MADTTFRAIQNGWETTLIQDLDADPAQLTVYCATVPEATIPAGKFVSVVLSARTTNQEIVKVESINTVNNTLTIASGGRGLNLGNGLAGTVNDHIVGATIIISADYILLNDYGDVMDGKVDLAGDTMTGQLNFSGTTYGGVKMISLTTAQRLALVGENGMIVYDTDLGLMFQYTAGAWGSIDTGTTTPNASTTVAGKVEIATQSENNAGTSTGGTGALLTATPDVNAVSIQNAVWTYAATATGNDTYAVTLVPALATLTNGTEILVKIDVANTGACTLNPNGLGNIAVKKAINGALADTEDGDLPANYIGKFIYNSTGPVFELINPANTISSKILTGKGTIATASAANTGAGLAAGSNGQHIIYDSAETTGLKVVTPYAAGQSSRSNASGTGNQDITHGLSGTPSYIQIFYVQGNANNQSFPTGMGMATAVGSQSCTTNAASNNTTKILQSATSIIYTTLADGTTNAGEAAISVIDSTKFRLNWTTAPSGLGNAVIYFQWVAFI